MACPMPFRQKVTLDGETYVVTMRMAEMLDALSRHMEEGQFQLVPMPDLHISTARALRSLGFIDFQERWYHTYATLTANGIRAVSIIRAQALSTPPEVQARRAAAQEKKQAKQRQSRSRV